MRIFAVFCVFVVIIHSCSSVKNLAVETDIARSLNQSELFSKHFTGFSLYDVSERKFIAGYNDTKRFTPASNVKLLTLYTTLKSFGDSIPSLLYNTSNDSLLVQPIGDPTFLHKDFSRQPVFDFLASFDSINIVWPVNEIKPYGPGWSWEDYVYAFQPQRSWWPMYGNNINIVKQNDSIAVVPNFFQDYVDVVEKKRVGESVERNLKFNLFKVYTDNDTSAFKRTIPFDYSKELLIELLSDTLKSEINISETLLLDADTLFAHSTDSLLALMLKRSDNFIAEQLLMLSAWKNGYSTIDPFIKHAKLIWLSDLNDFVWVDGSGLSRYNLISPVDMVRLYIKLTDEHGIQKIVNLLPSGGEPGSTIEDWYLAEEPYLYAKTGTLSNNHNLSGFIKTRSGKWMIFSFMNNHFTTDKDEVKTEMQKLLAEIRDSY